MMNSSVTVSAELGLSLVVPDHGSVPLVASLYYSADDPYAIRMAFHVGLDEPVEGTDQVDRGGGRGHPFRGRQVFVEIGAPVLLRLGVDAIAGTGAV